MSNYINTEDTFNMLITGNNKDAMREVVKTEIEITKYVFETFEGAVTTTYILTGIHEAEDRTVDLHYSRIVKADEFSGIVEQIYKEADGKEYPAQFVYKEIGAWHRVNYAVINEIIHGVRHLGNEQIDLIDTNYFDILRRKKIKEKNNK